MKKNKNIIILVIILVIILGVVLFFAMKQNKSEETQEQAQDQETQIQQEYSLIDMNNTINVEIEGDSKINNSSELLKEKTLLGMRISNIRLAAENGMTNFTADVENTSGEDFAEREITIVFINQDGTEFARLPGHLPDIKSGESNKIDASITSDLSNAYDFVIE